MSDDPTTGGAVDDASIDEASTEADGATSDVTTTTATGPLDHDEPTAGTDTQRVVFWASMAVGAAITLLGLNGLRTARLIDRPKISGGLEVGTYTKFFIGGAVVVDVLVLPLAAGLGLLARRVVPQVVWPTVRNALFTSGVLLLFAYPLVASKGYNPAKPSLRPRNYDTGLLWSLVVVWVIAAGFAAYGYVERRRAASAASD